VIITVLKTFGAEKDEMGYFRLLGIYGKSVYWTLYVE
jgi:hypothetical protein